MRMRIQGYRHLVLAMIALTCLLAVTRPDASLAAINGTCANCHTMHNSQNNGPMTFNNSSTPNAQLLKGTCYGCHAMGINSATYDLGTDRIPQVMHSGSQDLAGGNFAYITGFGGKGTGGQNRGHNISDLTGMGTDSDLTTPPGMISSLFHSGWLNTTRLRCAGSYPDGTIGCHGYRNPTAAVHPQGITGSHHSNADGKLDVADTPGNSYRFLMGVMGYEDTDWEYTTAGDDHNEYFGRTTPIMLGCSAVHCHGGNDGVKPPNGTMSQFCATCHGNFHTIANGTGFFANDGIGPDAVSPFIRHPTDLALPAVGEYAAYTAYNNQAPVARTGAVPDAPIETWSPADGNAVMCLSCHRAHATEFPDMLRWNYSTIIAGEGIGNTNGCFICHTSKN